MMIPRQEIHRGQIQIPPATSPAAVMTVETTAEEAARAIPVRPPPVLPPTAALLLRLLPARAALLPAATAPPAIPVVPLPPVSACSVNRMSVPFLAPSAPAPPPRVPSARLRAADPSPSSRVHRAAPPLFPLRFLHTLLISHLPSVLHPALRFQPASARNPSTATIRTAMHASFTRIKAPTVRGAAV